MLTAADVVLLALVLVGLPLRAWVGMRALRRAGAAAAERRPALWRRAIVSQWLLAAALGAVWLWRQRGPEALQLVPRASGGLAGVLLGVAFVTYLALRQRRVLAEEPGLRERIRSRLAPAEPLMPHTPAEWPGFVPLAITAGICEELLFRGFLTWVLSTLALPFVVVLVGQGALFGLGHAYQGPRGMLLTGALGIFLGAVAWVSGSLWACMLIHALVDLNAGDLAIRVYGAEAAPR